MIEDALKKLTASALLLPGLSGGLEAAVIPDSDTFSLRATQYQEDNIKSEDNLIGTDVDRYDIQVLQLAGMKRLHANRTISARLAIDAMTGASPWFITRDGDEAKIVTSPSKIEDTRYDFAFSTTRYEDRFTNSFSIGASNEDDYLAIFGSWNHTLEAESKQQSTSFGLDFSYDTISPESVAGIDPIFNEETKNSFGAFLNGAFDINPTTRFLVGGRVSHSSGYLSDPYKLVTQYFDLDPTIFTTINDERPEERTSILSTFEIRKHWVSTGLTTHLDYRFFDDDWGIQSHTVTARVAYSSDWGQWSHYIRSYQQDAANFYDTVHVIEREDGFYSSDYRLSAFDATSFGTSLVVPVKNWKTVIDVEFYDTKSSEVGLSGLENPALIEFWRVTLGFDYAFE
ncbi:MAG: DUF3570 domain-containing protein [Pseudomonadota bacterium]